MSITAQVESITPAAAKKLLATWDGNRPVSNMAVDRYAKMIENGTYDSMNGETLKIDKEGKMIDGQHRCLAVIKAEKALKVLVVRGIDHNAFKTIDSGRTRSIMDVISIAGVPLSAAAAAAARLIIQIDTLGYVTMAPYLRPSRREIIDYVIEHQDALHESAKALYRSKAKMLLGVGVPTALHYLVVRGGGDGKRCETFLTEVGTAIYETDNQKQHPPYALHERLIQLRIQRVKYPASIVAALAIKAWNQFVRNKHAVVMRFNAGETFPKILVK